MFLVLLAQRDNVWKVADFGLTSEGASRRAHTTQKARGTDCYRAPELIQKASVSKKSDIWSLGCILYELVSGVRAFPTDWDLYEYSRARESCPELPSLDINERLKTALNELMRVMFALDWWKRPSARDILKVFGRLSQKTTDVFIYNCPPLESAPDHHPLASSERNKITIPTTSSQESAGGTQVLMRLNVDMKIWERVSWEPFWYDPMYHKS